MYSFIEINQINYFLVHNLRHILYLEIRSIFLIVKSKYIYIYIFNGIKLYLIGMNQI